MQRVGKQKIFLDPNKNMGKNIMVDGPAPLPSGAPPPPAIPRGSLAARTSSHCIHTGFFIENVLINKDLDKEYCESFFEKGSRVCEKLN